MQANTSSTQREELSTLDRPEEKSTLTTRVSTALEDRAWDAFLESIPHGQVQQSSLWARSKEIEGWRPLRVLLENEAGIQGGFQMLIRQGRVGRIAYIAKGPALATGNSQLVENCFKAMVSAARANSIRALVVQGADETEIQAERFASLGSVPNRLLQVIKATLLIDVRGPMDAIVGRMRRSTLVELKRAQKRGIKIREGTEQDLPVFFELMLATCKRQETAPSPGSLEALRQVWGAFRPQNRIRLTLAECEGRPIAGAICLCFGSRVTAWKKGWSGAHRDKHPNQMVMFEAIQWSHQNGYKTFDCMGMSRSTAESLLNGRELTDEQKRGYDFFLLGYGGRPVLLPEPWLYIGSPAARFAYRIAANYSWFGSVAESLARSG